MNSYQKTIEGYNVEIFETYNGTELYVTDANGVSIYKHKVGTDATERAMEVIARHKGVTVVRLQKLETAKAALASVENRHAQRVERDGLMISLNDRQTEFVEAIERAAKSDLKVYTDFEKDSFVVVNGEKNSEYRVALKTAKGKVLVSCECGDFKNRNRICKHSGVVLFENLFSMASDLAEKLYSAEVAR